MSLAGGGGRAGTRWFRAYNAYGKPAVVIESVARFLRQENLTDTVVSLRVERGATGEFLLFLAMETTYPGVVPEDVEDALSDCRHLLSPLPEPLTLAQIEGLASGDLQIKALGQCLEYRQVRRDIQEDPFDTEARILMKDAELPVGAGEKLLWFLSATGTGPWSSLRAAGAALGILDAVQVTRLVRHLRLLGHLETFPAGRWQVSPPAAVEVTLPGGETCRFLVGARDSRRRPGERAEAQPGGPDRVLVDEAGERSVLFSPAGSLVEALPDAAGFVTSLEVLGSVNERALKLRQFSGEGFVSCAGITGDGLYELTSPDGRSVHALRRGRDWRRGEFTALRFLTLSAMNLLGPWRFSADAQELAVRFDERPPELYERALVLCSGLLPGNRGGWLVYRNVTAPLVAGLAGRLGLTWENT